MSINLAGTYTTTSNAAIASFDTSVKQAYQGVGTLRPTVTLKTGVVGDAHNFRKFGALTAVQHSSQELITPADATHTKIAATLSDWRVGDYTDLFDEAETNIDERAQLAVGIASALGRAEDQLVIAALDAASSIAGTVDEDLGGTDSLINAPKLRRAKRYLMAQQTVGGDHYFVINAAGLEGALSETEVTSADYQTMKALVDADLNNKHAFGFTFKVIEDRVEGGLPTGSSNIRLCFAYDKAAIGLAEGVGLRVMTDWIAERVSWLSQGILKVGSAVIDPKGVVEVQSYESA